MKKLIDGLLLVSLVALLSFSCAQIGFAQSSSSATIRGTILDPQARAIPNATVTVRNVDTGQERGTTTTNDGIYVVPNLAPGTYDVRVEVSGFSKGTASNVKIEVGDTRDVNFILKLATVSAEVKVSGETPLVETTRTDLSATINDKQIAGLPVFNTGVSALNDYANLATTAPGVRFDATGNSNDLLGPGAYNDRGNLVNVDGGNITDQVVSTRDTLGASLDEVKEFQVITNSYNAEYGQAGSVILNVITKSGTNSFHGSGHAFFRGRNLSASDYFYNTFDANAAHRRAPFQRQTWGLNGGGPVIKDKTFWFLNFEKVHQSVPLTLTHQPPNDTAVTVQQPDNEILWSAKVDHQLFTNHQLSFRFNEQRQIFDNLLVQVPQFAAPSSLVAALIHDHTLNVGLVSTVTPRVVNEARFFWHRFLTSTPTKSSLVGVRTSNTYTGAAFCCPQGGLQHRYQYLDNLTWTRGTHTIKGGVNISHFPYNSLFQQFHFGEYDFRVGTLTEGFGPAFVQTSDTIYGLYVQDSWKLMPSLTFNYGVRYDYEDGGLKGGTQAKPGGGCFQANGIIPACSSDKNNWQPRVGLAWSPRFDSGAGHWLFGGPDQSVIRASFAEVTELAYLNVSLDSLNFDGVNLLTVGIPTNDPKITPYVDPAHGGTGVGCAPNPAPCQPPVSVLNMFKPVGKFGRIRPISDHLKNPETRHFNFDITRQIGNSYVVSAGYIGVLGFGQFGERDMNFPAILPDTSHPGFFFFGPRPDARFLAIRTNENSRSSAYHGGYVKMEKRFSHHFQAQGYYIYSKTLASTEDFYGTSEPGDPRNIRAERGPAQNDLRHLATFSFVVDTGSLTKTSFVNHIVNNWSLGMVGTLHSGPHYPISTGEGPFSGSIFPGVGAETQQRPNILPDGTLIATNIASRAGGNLQISENGLVVCPTCAQTTFLAPSSANGGGASDSLSGDVVDFQFLNGKLMRNIAVADPLYRFDISLGKTVKVTERIGLEFRVDVENLFNRRNFTLFNGNDVMDNILIGVSGNAPPNDPNAIGYLANCDPAFGPCKADLTCVVCIRAAGPLTGRYIGSDGRVMKLKDFLHGRVSKDLTNPIFGGAQASVGDPTSTDGPRRIQLSFRVHW